MELLKPLFLLTAKPALYIANVEEHGFVDNPLLEKVKAYAAKEGAPVVAICAKIESEIADLSGEEKEMFLEDMGMHEPGLDRLIRATFDLLGLQTYFTAGEKEVRAWTIHKGDTARRRPASSTPTSKRASSAPRSSPTTTSSPARASTGEAGGEDAAGGQGVRREGRGRDALSASTSDARSLTRSRKYPKIHGFPAS